MDIMGLIKSRLGETYELHRKYVNPQMVRVLKVLGYDRNYTTAQGNYLVDANGVKVLDFLGGFGVFNVGRNNPVVKDAVRAVLDSNPASMVQMDVGLISGLLAEALAQMAPGELSAVFFTNSGAEGVEGAIKFARQATGRTTIVHCKKGFHGQTMGALSVNGNREFTDRNHPLLPDCVNVPFNDIDALERVLRTEKAAGFIFEPVQGKGVFVPDDGYLPAVRELCDRFGTLMIADEVQTGLGRTGKMFAVQHWDVTPDIMIISKALSGGLIPVGAIITTREIHAKIFDSMDRCFAHSNTFGQNDLAMAAGLAALHVLSAESLPQNAMDMGRAIVDGLEALADKYEMLGEIRHKGLMIGIQFAKPESLGLKTGWSLLHKLNQDLFCQMITIPLLEKHNILTQVAGHGLDTVKILPPLTITMKEVNMFLTAMEDVLRDAHTFPGSAWTTVKNLGIKTAKTA